MDNKGEPREPDAREEAERLKSLFRVHNVYVYDGGKLLGQVDTKVLNGLHVVDLRDLGQD